MEERVEEQGMKEQEDRKIVELLTKHHYVLRSYLAVAVGDHAEAEDLFQEVSLTVWERRADFRPGTDFRAWLLTVARHRVLAYHKKRRSGAMVANPEVLESLAEASCRFFRDADQSYIDARKRALRTCMGKLKGQARRVLEYRYEPSMSVDGIAQQLGVTVQRVYGILKRARAALRRCVSSELKRDEVTA
jgi:RNA polymerase sigma-70 factor (ECF subfamily)